ncbi:MAG: M36 family metallopeptidase [Saprospiraceae bacterium]|nr:M36 family metallopeptidase [Saprospiraceae bacterium]
MLFKEKFLCLLFSFCVVVVAAQPHEQKVLSFIQSRTSQLNLEDEDLKDVRIVDYHESTLSGIHHYYLQQFAHQLPIRTARAGIHLSDSGEVIHHSIGFFPNLKSIGQPQPNIEELQALHYAAAHLEIDINKMLTRKTGEQMFENESFSKREIPVRLLYVPDHNQQLRLAWELQVHPVTTNDAWVLLLDAQTGKELLRENLLVKCDFGERSSSHTVNSCSHERAREDLTSFSQPPLNFDGAYNAFHYPIESPLFGTRSLKSGNTIIDQVASPSGWHTDQSDSYAYTRGNNVFAVYLPTGRPILGSPIPVPITRDFLLGTYLAGNVPQPANLEFDYSNSLDAILGTAFLEDAITNLFVWNNICHDVFYQYGFNEAAGNFQTDNVTGAGLGDDAVLAGVQDGTDINQAAFTRSAEGDEPYMRVHLWNTAMPDKIIDGSFDNLVVVHEYGHGVTGRLLGGGNTISCFGGTEHGDEGWSDFFGLLLTMQDIDGDDTLEEFVIGEGIRGIGNYLRNDGLSNCANSSTSETCGLRPTAYSTSFAINPYTYGDVSNLAVPHGVGFAWCTMLWEMTWNLINEHGFEPNIYEVSSNAGNIRAMKLVIEGIKMTPCNGSTLNFLQMRDAILSADTALYSGANSDLIWAAFAKRGLGFSAEPGGQEAFDMPTLFVEKTVDQEEIELGEHVVYEINVHNNSSSTLSNVQLTDDISSKLSVTEITGGGVQQGNTISWSLGGLAPNSTRTLGFTATTATGLNGTEVLQENDLESTALEFIMVGLWQHADNDATGARSGDRFFEHAGYPLPTDGSLVLTLDLDGTKNNHLSFWQNLDTESGYDGGVIEINQGGEWQDLSDRIRKNAYNGGITGRLPIGIPTTTLDGRRAFTGISSGYFNTIIDLTGLSGSTQIRFRFATDSSNDSYSGPNQALPFGWRLDDFQLLDLESVTNEACATETISGITDCGDVGAIGTILFNSAALPVEWLSVDAISQEESIDIQWSTATEINNAGFEIEKSTNASDWKNIAWVSAKGTNGAQYSLSDKEVLPSIRYYYRIRQVDYDDRYSYSEIVSAIINPSETTIKVFPNPANEQVHILLLDSDLPEGRIELMSANGQTLEKRSLQSDIRQYHIPVYEYPSGVYLIRISTPSAIWSQQVIIDKE